MELLVPGIVTIIVTMISGYFAVKVARVGHQTKNDALVAQGAAKDASAKADELSDALDLLHDLNRRLRKVEEERDECREELKLIKEFNKEMMEALQMTKQKPQ